MCNRYPDCPHAGPLVDERAGIPRHCETMLPNDTCYYHQLGCKGCTFKNDALLALVAGVWQAYVILQRMVAAGDVSEEWASKSLHNVIQYTYRQAVCRIIGNYIDARSNE